MASWESLCPPSIGLSLFWPFHLAVIPSSHSLENSESHTLLGRVSHSPCLQLSGLCSPSGSNSPTCRSLIPVVLISSSEPAIALIATPPSSFLRATISFSSCLRSKKSPSSSLWLKKRFSFLQGMLQPCPYKRMGSQTLKKHQNHKMQTRPTSTEEEGGHVLRGTGWDRAF